jgi:hypothetical protein
VLLIDEWLCFAVPACCRLFKATIMHSAGIGFKAQENGFGTSFLGVGARSVHTAIFCWRKEAQMVLRTVDAALWNSLLCLPCTPGCLNLIRINVLQPKPASCQWISKLVPPL